MTTLDDRMTIGQLVTDRPSRARIFEQMGIDYCCGGALPLGRACARKGLDVGTVLRALESLEIREAQPEPVEWEPASLGELIDRIVAVHHGHLRRELPRLVALAEKVVQAHGGRHHELKALRRILAALKDDLDAHMLREEWALFPSIKRLETMPASTPDFGGDIDRSIHDLEHEHDDVGSALERLRALTGGYAPPADACPTYRALFRGLAELEADLHYHVHEENNILFPRALDLLASLRTRAVHRPKVEGPATRRVGAHQAVKA